MKKVFLLADIGKGKNDGYFHFGDEAMFWANVQRYKSLNFEVYASSRSISHKSKLFTETLDIYIDSYNYFVYLLSLINVLKQNGVNLFPSEFKPTIKAVLNSNLLHISGGGNINETWPGHIYYRCFMIELAYAFNIPVIWTSQTISSIKNTKFKKILNKAFSHSCFIGVRDLHQSFDNIKKFCSDKSIRVEVMLDDAFNYPNLPEILAKNEKDKVLGLSLHSLDLLNDDKLSNLLAMINHLVKESHFNKIFLLPHVINQIHNKDDLNLMKKLFKNTNNIKIDSFDYNYFNIENANDDNSVGKMLSLYGSLSGSICTRYHGLVFSSIYNIPTLIYLLDDYYSQKLFGFLNLLSINDTSSYTLTHNSKIPQSKNFEHLSYITLPKILSKYLCL